MRALRIQIRAANLLHSPVLLDGATGAGKEVVARELHRVGPRRHGPFVPVNMASTTLELAESKLFGHEQGAFTGAHRRHHGAFERAHGGILFLDEIAETPLPVQASLLRVLQDSRVTRVGSEVEIPVDVRVVAATNRSLQELVEAKAFREDLFFRLCVSRLRVPALDEHLEDIPILVSHFSQRLGDKLGREMPAFSRAALNALQARRWRGNVRELIARVEHVLATCFAAGMDAVEAQQVEDEFDEAFEAVSTTATPAAAGGLKASMREFEKCAVQAALSRTRGNVRKAAELLHEPHTTLHSRMRRLGLLHKPEA